MWINIFKKKKNVLMNNRKLLENLGIWLNFLWIIKSSYLGQAM